MPVLSWIPAPLIRVDTASRPDLDQFIVGGVFLPPTGANSYVRLWKVNPNFTSAGELVFAESAGKDDSVSFHITKAGTVIVIISEAIDATASGSTSVPAAYAIPYVFPAMPAPVAGVQDSRLTAFLSGLASLIASVLK